MWEFGGAESDWSVTITARLVLMGLRRAAIVGIPFATSSPS
jgi:hypothetical protein